VLRNRYVGGIHAYLAGQGFCGNRKLIEAILAASDGGYFIAAPGKSERRFVADSRRRARDEDYTRRCSCQWGYLPLLASKKGQFGSSSRRLRHSAGMPSIPV